MLCETKNPLVHLLKIVMSLLLHCNNSHSHVHPDGKDNSILRSSGFSLPKGFRNHGNLTFTCMETIIDLLSCSTI